MNSLQTLFLESLLNVKIGSMNFNATEFEGHLSMQDIERLCDNGDLHWQNPEAPRHHIAYVAVYFDSSKCDLSIDTSTNTIMVAGAQQ